jgi:hypothetical protein
MFCNSENYCASCNYDDANCGDDYLCSETGVVCVPDESLSAGAIIGIIISAFAVLFAVIVVISYCCKKKSS